MFVFICQETSLSFWRSCSSSAVLVSCGREIIFSFAPFEFSLRVYTLTPATIIFSSLHGDGLLLHVATFSGLSVWEMAPDISRILLMLFWKRDLVGFFSATPLIFFLNLSIPQDQLFWGWSYYGRCSTWPLCLRLSIPYSLFRRPQVATVPIWFCSLHGYKNP